MYCDENLKIRNSFKNLKVKMIHPSFLLLRFRLCVIPTLIIESDN